VSSEIADAARLRSSVRDFVTRGVFLGVSVVLGVTVDALGVNVDALGVNILGVNCILGEGGTSEFFAFDSFFFLFSKSSAWAKKSSMEQRLSETSARLLEDFSFSSSPLLDAPTKEYI